MLKVKTQKNIQVNIIIEHISDRFCPDPHQPPIGGEYDWDRNLTMRTPFRHAVEYSCKLGRRISPEDNNEELSNKINFTCEWNQTWSPRYEVIFWRSLF